MLISACLHPDYSENSLDWQKWRLAYLGGRTFIDRYLQQLSSRETSDDFLRRKNCTFVPKYAAAAINEIKNSIYQRMADVTRIGGPDTYVKACSGLVGGVDLQGTQMNAFIGTNVLLEMLLMRRVGVLVDAPADLGSTLLDKGDKHPFFTIYTVENIRSWKYELVSNVRTLVSVLLREYYEVESEYGLVSEKKERYRLLQLDPSGRVKVSFFEGEDLTTPVEITYLNLKKIPFHIFEIESSLMQDAADYQIALLNLESSDISMAMKGNYPFFYEYFDPKSDPEYSKGPSVPGGTGVAAAQNASKSREVAIGATQGRRYPIGLDAPGFVNPSPETLVVSMQKGENLKQDIYRIVNLTLENNARSAESKKESKSSLESGLSYLGLILQKGEMCLAEYWNNFENTSRAVTVKYPETYSLKTQQEKLDEADALTKQMNKIPSRKYKELLAKKIARILVGSETDYSTMREIEKEITDATTLTCDPEVLVAMHDAGMVSTEDAALAAGFTKASVEQAKKDHADRIKRIMDAQGGPQNASPAAGANDFGTSKGEKVGKPKRGDGKVGGRTK